MRLFVKVKKSLLRKVRRATIYGRRAGWYSIIRRDTIYGVRFRRDTIFLTFFDFDKTEISEIPHLVEMHLMVVRRTLQHPFASRRDASLCSKTVPYHPHSFASR